MSSTGVMMGMDRRRAGSIGIEERALTTLEKFVELCDTGYVGDDEVDEVAGNVLDSLAAAAATSATPSSNHRGGMRDGTIESGLFSQSMKKPIPDISLSQNKAKLCELFIDRSLVEMKTKANGMAVAAAEKMSNRNGNSGKTSPSTQKKSEEIWVKRVTDPSRRSFRSFRGQQLPSILTEDVDEATEATGANTGTTGSKMPGSGANDEDARTRHRSGGDEAVNRSGGTKTNAILDAFRPRSKSDVARLKKPTFMSTMKTAVQNSLLSASSSSSSGTTESQKNQNSSANSSSGHRPRSGSESLRSPVSKVMDMFRNRSHSVNASDDKRHRHKHGSSNSWTPAGARRSSLHSHRPSDVSLDPAHAAILFRDSRGLPVADPFLERVLNLSEEEENEILVKFFKFHKCYDLIPTSAKLVVFDTQLLVKKAFFALVYNGVRAAPLWDSTEREFVGMLTITDFIRVLHAMYSDSAGRMSELEEHRVETWRRRFLQDKQPLISIDPDASLYDAICSLVNNRIHRLPVIDKHTGNVLHILTHKRILKFLFLYINEIPRPSFLNKRLREVKIGTFDNVETAREDTPIIQALQKFLDRRVSALPIVDVENRLLDIYARFDVINLAAEKTYNNLDITLKQANEHRNEWFEGVHKCTLDDTLFVIMEKIVKAEVHRLVVVDEQDRVIGVISLSDILQYLVMRPELKEVDDKKVQEIHDSIRREKAEAEATSANKDSQILRLETEETERENPTINEEEEDEKT